MSSKLFSSKKCEWCGKRKKLTKHHVKNRIGDKIFTINKNKNLRPYVIPLCRECHDYIENDYIFLGVTHHKPYDYKKIISKYIAEEKYKNYKTHNHIRFLLKIYGKDQWCIDTLEYLKSIPHTENEKERKNREWRERKKITATKKHMKMFDKMQFYMINPQRNIMKRINTLIGFIDYMYSYLKKTDNITEEYKILCNMHKSLKSYIGYN